MKKEYDSIDKSILSYLIKDGRMKFLDIARKLRLASGTIHARIGKYRKNGLINGYEINLNIKELGYDITSFIGVSLAPNSDYQIIVKKVITIPEVLEVHYTTGNYGLFLKVIAKNIDHFHEILYHKLQKIEGIEHTETIISLDVPLERHYPDPLFQN